MRSITGRHPLRWRTLLLAFAAAGCAEPVTQITASRDLLSDSPSLLSCRLGSGESASVTVGPEGGTFSAGGSRVSFPAGAVAQPTTFTLTLPTSTVAEIAVSPAGGGHYQFAAPVTITIDYRRCESAIGGAGAFTVWYIDGATKAPLQHMGGTDDRANKRITFTTDHFSSYAIAE